MDYHKVLLRIRDHTMDLAKTLMDLVVLLHSEMKTADLLVITNITIVPDTKIREAQALIWDQVATEEVRVAALTEA